jgi:hypothetical protein
MADGSSHGAFLAHETVAEKLRSASGELRAAVMALTGMAELGAGDGDALDGVSSIIGRQADALSALAADLDPENEE